MAVNRTILSAGEIIQQILTNDAEVSSRAGKVFPVVCDEAKLPYIIYRRTGMEQIPVKRVTGADTASIEIMCCTANYSEGIDLAEAVRAALDGISYSYNGLTLRSCTLVDSEESWQDDAYIQSLVFNVKI